MMLRHLILALGTLSLPALAQNTWYVDANHGNPPGDGSPGNPFTEIQTAIDAVTTQPGDRLEIAAGVYHENVTLTKSLDLVGADASTTIVDAGGSGTVLSMAGLGDVLVGRLTFTGGELMGDGGGVKSVDSDLRMALCVLRDNKALCGAGLYADGGSVFLDACVVQDNRGGLNQIAGYGGGTYTTSGTDFVADRVTYERNGSNESQGSPTQSGGGHFGPGYFDDCTFRENRAQEGAGLYSNQQSMFIEESLIVANRADTDGSGIGGGVYGPAELEFCVLADNVVAGDNTAWGGGAYRATLRDCEVRGNRALISFAFAEGAGLSNCTALRCVLIDNDATTGFGGGAFQSDLERCVLIGNKAEDSSAAESGSLVHCSLYGNVATGPSGAAVSATLLNCALAGNVPTSLSPWSTATYCVLPGGFAGTGNVDADPGFVDASAGDLHLGAGSPCIDAGDPTSPPDPDGSIADVGAFPFESTAVSLNFDDLALGSLFESPEVEFLYDSGTKEAFVSSHGADSSSPHAINGRVPGSTSTSCFQSWERLDMSFPQPVENLSFSFVCDSCLFFCDIIGEATLLDGSTHFFALDPDSDASTAEYVDLTYLTEVVSVTVQVFSGTSGSIDDLGFDIVDCPSTIGNYCTSTAFSTGQPSVISAPNGLSQSISEGSGPQSTFTLVSDNLPTGQPGRYIAGPLQAELPFFNGYNGTFCISPSIVLRLAAGSDIPVGGVSSVTFDLEAMVFSGGSLVPLGVQPGDTYNFQRWNRDPAGGGGAANFSNGIQICFRP